MGSNSVLEKNAKLNKDVRTRACCITDIYTVVVNLRYGKREHPEVDLNHVQTMNNDS